MQVEFTQVVLKQIEEKVEALCKEAEVGEGRQGHDYRVDKGGEEDVAHGIQVHVQVKDVGRHAYALAEVLLVGRAVEENGTKGVG